MPEENTPKNPAEHDSFAKALRRTARPAHFASLARRAAACLRERGAEALWREASFRISLMTKGEVWRFRADIPLRRELKASARRALPACRLCRWWSRCTIRRLNFCAK